MESAKHRYSQTLQEFFKVFMPHTTSTHLGIPKAFTELFNGAAPSRVTLLDLAGKCWDVELEKIKDGLVLTNGWQQFVSDKRLVEADFLVFEYDGDSTFSVKIFSKNGIRKEPDQRLVPIVALDDDDDDDECEKKNAAGGPAATKRVPPMKNPHFVIPFSSWRLSSSSLELPKLVMRKLNMKLKATIEMRDENDKVWPVEIRKGGRTYLSTGWSDFLKAKKVKEGQMCAFKFVIGEDNVAHQLLVRLRRRPPSTMNNH